jgi:hypothetical protein
MHISFCPISFMISSILPPYTCLGSLQFRIPLQNVVGVSNLNRATYPIHEIIEEQEMPALIFWVSIRHFNFL